MWRTRNCILGDAVCGGLVFSPMGAVCGRPWAAEALRALNKPHLGLNFQRTFSELGQLKEEVRLGQNEKE